MNQPDDLQKCYMAFFKQAKWVRPDLSLRAQIRVLLHVLQVIVFMPAEWAAMVAMLCLSFHTLLIIAYSAVNSRGDNEAQNRVSAELWRGNAFLFCTTGPYLYVCGNLDSCNHACLAYFHRAKKWNMWTVEMCNFIKVIEYYLFSFWEMHKERGKGRKLCV